MNKAEEILKAVKFSDANKVKFAVVDIDGILRGKTITKSKFLKGLDEHFPFCNVVFGWDANDAAYDYSEVTGWHTGYPDSMSTIDLNTFRKIPWDGDVPFFLADFSESDTLSGICPRTLLKKIRQQCLDMGYIPKFANEFEWFNFRETPQSLKEKGYQNPTPLTPGMFGYSMLRSSQNQTFFNSIYDLLHSFDVPVEGMHTETGDGVYEACIEYTDVLEAADRAVLFKNSVKKIAGQHEIIASFMAKWNPNLPGCSGHIHQSLWDSKTDSNQFYNPDKKQNISSLLDHYIAGQLYCLPFILPMYAPTVNSYKRLVKGSWASTSVSWGVENRTTALRVINHSADSMRLETRTPGSDANPYLSMAAALASGLYGIRNKLANEIPETTGNEYENLTSQKLPDTLEEAMRAMNASDISDELFGESFTKHFAMTRKWEWERFSKAVTDWELKRYFEII